MRISQANYQNHPLYHSNFFSRWSVRNLNYTKSNKKKLNILIKKKHGNTENLTISFYEFSYFEMLYNSFIINAASYISIKILFK